MQTPLTTLASAVMVMVTERSGDWLLVRFNDPRWGRRVGYAHCSLLRALDIATVEGALNEPPPTGQPDTRSNTSRPVVPASSPSVPPGRPAEMTRGRPETVEEYAEWIREDHLLDLEDQADRVGLRYAFEGGFDVRQGVPLWSRARARSGEFDPVSNFLFGSHSRPSDRIKNIERELALNYWQGALR